MPGFEINRFIDLSENVAKHVICGVCLNILDNAIRTDCEHLFCKDCIEESIEHNHKECPICREKFVTRIRNNSNRNDNKLVIFRNFIFKRDLSLNNIINDLKVKCEYESNGCQQTIQLSQFTVHISQCKHRFCNTCGLTFGKIGEHHCFQLLKNCRNDWKLKYEKELEINCKLKEDINQLKANVSELKTELWYKSSQFNKLREELSQNKDSIKTSIQKTLKKIPDFCDSVQLLSKSDLKEEVQQYLRGLLLLADHFSPNIHIMFGGRLPSYYGHFFLDYNKIQLNSLKRKSNGRVDLKNYKFNLPLYQLQEVLYSRCNFCPSIDLKITKQIWNSFTESLHLIDGSLNDYLLDVNSNVSKDRYIYLEFDDSDIFECCLRCLRLFVPKIKFVEQMH